jgi:fructose PTS system EIIA component
LISRKAVGHLQAAIFIRNLNADSEYEAISQMLARLQGHVEVQDWQKLSAAVFDRQQTDRPLFPGGIAFPHARTDCVSSLVMVIATCSKPIPFGEMPVRLIFLIGIPKRAGAEYLELIWSTGWCGRRTCRLSSTDSSKVPSGAAETAKAHGKDRGAPTTANSFSAAA